MRRTFPTVVAMLAAAWSLSSAPVQAGKANDTLVWASNLELERADYYFNVQGEGLVLANLVWDRLIYRDPDDTTKYRPMLAESWKWTDDVTLDFTLRQGITFHNGEKFDADDVVYTLNFVRDKKNRALGQWRLNWIKDVEKLGEYQVRINLKAPFLAAIDHLAQAAAIYPDEYYRKVGPKGMSKNPVGTGPYKVVENTRGKRIVLKKNDDYFAASPRGKPSIGTIIFRPIPDSTTQIAELLGGGVDWIWRLTPDQKKQIGNLSRFATETGPTTRIGYIGMDAIGRAGDHPLKDIRVRQAIAHAINRQSIVDNLMGGGAKVIHAPCYPPMFGCVDDTATRYEYNPEKAKALLAEAGYPNGFSVDFDGYRERPFVEAMIGDLHRVGIKARLVWQRYPTLRKKVRSGKSVINFMTFGAARIYDVTAIMRNFFQGSGDDMAQDKVVHELLQKGENGKTEEERLKYYRQAFKRITTNLPWLPTFSYSLHYAFTKDLNFKAYDDGVPRFELATWK